MQHIVALGPYELSIEERNLISVAYRNILGARRASWRIISSIEQKEEENGRGREGEVLEERVRMCVRYRERIEEEIKGVCGEVLALVHNQLSQDQLSPESKIFFLRMYVLTIHVTRD